MASGSNALTFDANTIQNVKMTFRGNSISVSVNGTECITYTDESAYTAGGVGVIMTRQGAGTVDYIRVTDVYGSSMFTEEFSDASRLSETGEAGYMLGNVYKKGSIGISEKDIKELVAKWTHLHKYSDAASLIQNNSYLYIRNNDNASSDNNYAHTLISLLDGDADIAALWADYSVEAKVKPEVFIADGNGVNRTRFGIIGRLHKNDDGSVSYFTAGFRADTKNLYLWHVTMPTSGSATITQLASVSNALESTPVIGQEYTLKMTFSGNAISVSLNGEEKISFETTGDNAQYAIASGTAGVRVLRGGTITFDDFKVTNKANQVIFEESFNSIDHLLNTGYACYQAKGVFYAEKPSAAPDDTTDEPDTTTSSSSVNLITGVSGDVDYAQTLKDYIVETDFMLDSDSSVAGLVARATGGGYYELRITKDKVALWKVTKSGEEELASAAAEVAPGSWQYAKMHIEGSVIKAYLGIDELFAFNNATDFTAGTVGLKAEGSVKFDNFAIAPADAVEVRRYRTFKFKTENVANLSDWHLQNDQWSIEEVMQTNPITFEDYYISVLTSQVDSGVASALLGNKRAWDNYAIEANAMLFENGIIGLMGRISSDATDYYLFRINVTTGAELVKVVDGKETVLASVSFVSLYENGTKLQPEEFYTLKLQMYGDVVEGYVDGNLILRAKDAEDGLKVGTSGVFGSKGAAFEYLSLAPVDVATSIEVVTLTDLQGKTVWSKRELDAIIGNPNDIYYNPHKVRSYPVATQNDPVEVFLGKVPDIKTTWLKINFYDGTFEYIELDKTEIEAFNGTSTGAKEAKVEYLNASTVFYYTVNNRPADIAQIKQELSQLQIPTNLDKEAYIKDLYTRFSDLSYMELADSGIPADSIKKMYEAMDAIDVLQSEELAGTKVLYRDTFDTSASESRYNSDSANLTWRGNPGYWYVENGTMYEYTAEDHTYPVRLSSSAVVVDEFGVPENWEIRSVSVDVQFVSTLTRAGIDFCFGGPFEERYNLNITDKDNRVTLNSNKAILGQAYALRDYGVEFVPGVWYNIRVTLDGEGLMKCYVNGRLWFHYKITPNAKEDHILTHGSVALYTSENHARFDNLVVRGVGEGEAFDEDYYNSISTDYVGGTDEYRDTFEDETAGKSPSHWIELNTEDKWLVKEDGTNKVYATKDNAKTSSHTWLHVFETNVDYSANIKVTEKGYLPVVALSSRVNADESFIRTGYDFSLQKWFISVRLGADFEPVITYSDAVDAAAAQKFLTDGMNLRVKLVNKAIELYADGVKVLTADADLKVMPGRVGVYADQCNVEVDDVVLKLLSGQGRVNDGVLEYYTNTGSSYHSVLEMWDDDGNQILLLYQDGIQSISVDGGQTFKLSTMFSDAGFKGNSSLELHDGTYINIKTRGGSDESIKNQRWVYYSNDGGKTWPHVGVVCTRPFASYAQPAEHINEVRLNETTWRVFYSLTCADTGHSEVFYTDYVEGMDNFGEVWHASKNTPSDFVNIGGFNESYVIQISRDTVDRNGKKIPAGTLIQYSSHNECNTMRYTLSYDNGETWVGDYAMPEIPCGDNSCCVKEDPYEPGTYYMVAPYNLSPGFGYNHPRFRNVLLRSYDGLNWEFLADVDRWGQITDYNHANIMQQVNAYICITEDYVFPTFSRSDQFLADAGHSHHMQIGRLYRFEKDKLDVYDEWPSEYVIPDKEITCIEVMPGKTRVELNDSDPLAGTTVKVNYYNAESETYDLAELMDMKDADKPRAFAVLPDLSTAGVKSVAIDYRHFRAVYTLQVGMGDTPVISYVADGKTYCAAPEVYVGDANGDLVSVTVNGEEVTLDNGKFFVYAKAGTQTIVATDAKGNTATVTITVNDGHSWSDTYTTKNGRHWKTCTVDGCDGYTTKYACSGGEATCTEQAICSTCGQAYGKLADHELVNGKCECGYEETTTDTQPGNGNVFVALLITVWEFIKKIFMYLLSLLGI